MTLAELVAALADVPVADFPNMTSARLAALLVREMRAPTPAAPPTVEVKPVPRGRKGRPLKLGRLPKGAEL